MTTGYRRIALLLVGVLLLAGCTSTPPPPLVSAPPKTKIATKPVDLKQIVLGVDRIGRGFNPHKISDVSTMTTALANELLPSVFRPAPDGTPTLDRTVMESAQVTSAAPFTVTYTVRQDASWSDGVPVRAEDFLYLRDQMDNQPGVVDPAGYRLITGITSADGGRVVEVQFAKPYPGWRSLFSDLLPGHTLKDAPGGWNAGLTDSFPSSAGPFSIRSLDRDRGEIILERNERYWGAPAAADSIVLRRTDVNGLTNGLRSGDTQLATVSSDAATAKSIIAAGPAVQTTTLPRDVVAQLRLRPTGQFASLALRKAVAAALNRTALINAGGGERSARADALVYAPSQPGYTPTMPEGAPGSAPDPHAVSSQLSASGYRKVGGKWSRGRTPLKITVAAVAGVEPYLSIARAATAQLNAAGITASLITPTADQLYGTLLNPQSQQPGAPQNQQVDVLVDARAVNGDPAGELASEYGCPATPTGGNTPYPDAPGAVCDHELEPGIQALLTGQQLLADGLPSLEKQIWAQAYSVPLFQVTDLLAVRNDIYGIGVDSAQVAPFPSAAQWTRIRQ